MDGRKTISGKKRVGRGEGVKGREVKGLAGKSCSLRVAETDGARSLLARPRRYLPRAPAPHCAEGSRCICRFGITAYIVLPNNAILLPESPRNHPRRHLAAPRLIARRALDPFFSNWAFWGNKRHRDWQLRRVRIGRVILNKCHKTEKLMSYLQGSRPSSLRESPLPPSIIFLNEHGQHRVLIFARIHARECVVIYCHCFRDAPIGSIIPVVLLNLKI